MEYAGLKRLLVLAAAGEALTGAALLASPALVARLLLGVEVASVGAAIARVTGIALIGLGVGCWPGPPTAGMLAYSGLVTAYFAYLGIRGDWAGPLLWPAVVVHAALTAGLMRAMRRKARGIRA